MISDTVPGVWTPRAQAVLRVVAGLEFLQHGTAKYLKFPVVPMYADFQPLSPAGVAGVFELVGSILLIIGLFTRTAAFLMSGVMAVGYFLVHYPHSFYPILNAGELAVLYCFVFLFFAVAGPGAWSLDGLRHRHHRRWKPL